MEWSHLYKWNSRSLPSLVISYCHLVSKNGQKIYIILRILSLWRAVKVNWPIYIMPATWKVRLSYHYSDWGPCEYLTPSSGVLTLVINRIIFRLLIINLICGFGCGHDFEILNYYTSDRMLLLAHRLRCPYQF